MVPVLIFGFIMLYWGWFALEQDFRPDIAQKGLYELMHSDSSEEDDSCEDEGDEE